MPDAFYTHLPNRALIHIEGADRHAFLQNIITNDMEQLKEREILYACFLTPQGKFLHDFFIHEGNDFLLLDCEGGARAEDLYKRLKLYRLRSDVQLSIEDNLPVYAVFGTEDGLPDPRHPELGRRSFEKPQDMPEAPFETWDQKRITLTIPDGNRDLIPERSGILEARMDELNGLSFEKGCYVGQEPTVRIRNRGLLKRKLYTVRFDKEAPPFGTPIEHEGKTVGEMRSSCGNEGLALLKEEAVEGLKKAGVVI